jgi:hypothetical protein
VDINGSKIGRWLTGPGQNLLIHAATPDFVEADLATDVPCRDQDRDRKADREDHTSSVQFPAGWS